VTLHTYRTTRRGCAQVSLGTSVCNRGHLAHVLLARQLSNHEFGHIAAGDAEAPRRDALLGHAVPTLLRPIRQEDRADGNPVEVSPLNLLEHFAMLRVHARQEPSEETDTEIAHEEANVLTERAGCGQDHESAHAMSLHRIEYVPHPLGEDGGRPPGGDPEGAEDDIVSGDCAIYGDRVEDIPPHDAEAAVDDRHPCRVAGQGSDLVALKEGLLRKEAACPACGPEENDLHSPSPTRSARVAAKETLAFPARSQVISQMKLHSYPYACGFGRNLGNLDLACDL